MRDSVIDAIITVHEFEFGARSLAKGHLSPGLL
jgi:hypothetical protein